MSRIFVYQANRKFTEEEATTIFRQVEMFVQQWQAHGKQLKADFDLVANLLVVLKVDETAAEASGCSIDDSVAFMKHLGETYGIDFFDRQQFAYEYNGAVCNDHLQNLDNLVNKGFITADTIVYNNLVRSHEEYENKFRVPFSQSWHKQLLSNQAAMA